MLSLAPNPVSLIRVSGGGGECIVSYFSGKMVAFAG